MGKPLFYTKNDFFLKQDSSYLYIIARNKRMAKAETVNL